MPFNSLQALTGFGRNSLTATQAIALVNIDLQTQINLVNVLYTDMINVFVTLKETYIRTASGVDAWNQEPVDAAALTGGTRHTNGCPVSRAVTDDSDYPTMLSNFGNWRGSLVATRRYATWHLMTNCFPPAGTVGLAYIGVTCDTGKSGAGWSSFQSEATWLTVAHEIGHNFGAYHTMTTGGIMSYDSVTTKEYKFTGANPSQVGQGHVG